MREDGEKGGGERVSGYGGKGRGSGKVCGGERQGRCERRERMGDREGEGASMRGLEERRLLLVEVMVVVSIMAARR
eukprot:1255763-Rhodomonas_salina.1